MRWRSWFVQFMLAFFHVILASLWSFGAELGCELLHDTTDCRICSDTGTVTRAGRLMQKHILTGDRKFVVFRETRAKREFYVMCLESIGQST